MVLNISEGQLAFSQEVTHSLQCAGLRVESDLRNEKITYKIREHSLKKLPYQLIVGDKEVAAKAVAVHMGRARMRHGVAGVTVGVEMHGAVVMAVAVKVNAVAP